MRITKITALAALLAGAFAPAPTFANPLERILNGILLSQTGRYYHDDDDDGRFRHRLYRYSYDDDDDDGRRRGGRGWQGDDDDDDDNGRRHWRGLHRDDDDD